MLLTKGYPDQPRDDHGRWTDSGGGMTRREFIRNRGLRAATAIALGLGIAHLPMAVLAIRNLVTGRPWYEDIAVPEAEIRDNLKAFEGLRAKGYRIKPNGDGTYSVLPPLSKGYPEFRPDQPRGDDGRWGGGSGTGALRRGHEARDLLARNLKAKPTPSLPKFMAGLTAEQRDYIRKTLRMLKGKRTTAEQFKNEDGTWMKSRRRLHDTIIHTRLRDAINRAKPAPGEAPKLVIMGGRPGSGKTTSLMHSGFVPDMDNYLYVNADDLRGDNKKWLRDGNKDYGLPGYAGWNSTLYHEEASMLAERLERAGRDLGLNIIHDATLRSPEASIAMMDEYQSKGYEVSGLFVHATPENASMRAIGRAMKSPTGRFVPSYLLGKYINEAAFDAIKDRMDQWKLYDANGPKAKLVAASRRKR